VPPTFEIVTTRKCWAVCSIKSLARIASKTTETACSSKRRLEARFADMTT
jgi:hypothetical protein